jgi:peptidoglycan/xylan/chitin deacetylase (PgdA/CDA1 family)
MSNHIDYTPVNNDLLNKNKVVCLTLDLEQDHAGLLEKPAYDGLKQISMVTSFLKERNIPLTVFVQGSLLETHPEAIKQLSVIDSEFELHSYSHGAYNSANTKYEIERGLKAYNSFFNANPRGYRFPCGVFNQDDYRILNDHGLKFDSSVFPSIRPNAFNNLNLPVRPYYLNDYKVMEFPFSVFSNIVRVPLALSYFKLFGWPYLNLIKTPFLPRFVLFNFHMHDLFTLPSSYLVTKNEASLLSRVVYRRIYPQKRNNGFGLFKQLVSFFVDRDYRFSRLDTIYDSLIQSLNIQDD